MLLAAREECCARMFCAGTPQHGFCLCRPVCTAQCSQEPADLTIGRCWFVWGAAAAGLFPAQSPLVCLACGGCCHVL
jgi:hypothetical protein